MLLHKLILFSTLIPIVLSYYDSSEDHYDYGDGYQRDRHSNQRLPSISTRSDNSNDQSFNIVNKVQGNSPGHNEEFERPLIEGPIIGKTVDKVVDKQGALHFDHYDLRSRMRSRYQDDVMKR